MFERYTERARRVIFFARYDASQYGSTTIETEHLLLGLIREDAHLIRRFVPGQSAETLRNAVAKSLTLREKVSTSMDLPLSRECTRILAYAADEAERLNHRHIGIEHLLLGTLREEECGATKILREHGFNLDSIRIALVHDPLPAEAEVAHDIRSRYSLLENSGLPKAGVVPDADTAMAIAEAVWNPLYGAETINAQKPLNTELKFNVWTVTGSVAAETEALFAFILQTDGRILSVGRGQEKK